MCKGKYCLSKRDAEAALKVRSKSGKQYRKEQRAYYCEDCNAWHLTSKEYVDPEEMYAPVENLLEKDRWEKLLNENYEYFNSTA